MSIRIPPFAPDEELRKALAESRELFDECMRDDFNTAGAIGAVFDVIHATNVSLGQTDGVDREAVGDAAVFLRMVDDVMGIIGIENESKGEDDAEIDAMIAERDEARHAKNFKRSDEIRDILRERGIILEDTPQGTRRKRE